MHARKSGKWGPIEAVVERLVGGGWRFAYGKMGAVQASAHSFVLRPENTCCLCVPQCFSRSLTRLSVLLSRSRNLLIDLSIMGRFDQADNQSVSNAKSV